MMIRLGLRLFQNILLTSNAKRNTHARYSRSVLVLLGIAGLISGSFIETAWGQTPTATTVSVTAGGSAVNSVASSTVVALTATVTAAGAPAWPGLVKFCDATANDCTDVHLLGSAQLNSSGVAVWRFQPGVGTHSYKAIFVGTGTLAASNSSTESLTVTIAGGQSPAANLLSESGTWGNYSLAAKVEAFGSTAPITGSISFEDTSNGNAVLATTPLGTSTPGLFWTMQTPCTNATVGNSTIAADFNGDGYPDVATVNSVSQTITILTYKPNYGCYYQTGSYSTGNSPGRIVIADFNSDGNIDLMILNGGGSTLTLLLGNGDGSFVVSTISLGTLTPYSVAIADFNGDGIPDVAVSGVYNSTIAILLGKGDGTFTSAAGVSLSPLNPDGFVTITPGDFTGDGKIDLLVPTATGVAVFAGNGDGTFNPAPVTTAISVPQDQYLLNPITADFDQDGKLDIAISAGRNVVPMPGEVLILRGNGDGTFTQTGTYTTPDQPLQLGVADFNLDGVADLAALDIGGDITVLSGTGDGTFASSYNATTGVSPFFQNFGLADMNGDGRPDFLFAGSYPPNSIVLYFDLTKPMETASTPPVAIAPSGVGQHLVVASYPGGANTASAASNPVSLWGTPPATTTSLAATVSGGVVSTVPAGTAVTLAATVTSGANKVTQGQVNFCDASASQCSDQYLLGTAQLTANGSATYTFIPGPGSHSYKAVFQINGYGAMSTSNTVPLSVSGGSTSLGQTTTTIAQSGAIGNYTLTATIAGSGSIAPLTGNVSFLDTSYSNNVLATVAVGNSTPGMNWNSLSSIPFTNVGWLQSVAGDFNRDGIPDLAVVNTNVQTMTVLLGNGDGTFKTVAGPAMTTYPAAIVKGDFNGDGKLDLAISSTGPSFNAPGTLTIFLGNGDGTFTAGYTATGVGAVIAAADFNGDGELDLVATTSSQTQILLGHGDGTFAAATTAGAFQTLAAADLNGDGVADLIGQSTANVNGGYATTTQLYLGNGDGSFRQTATTFAVSNSEGIQIATIGDFNGDGISDVAVDGNYSSSPVVFLGKGDGTFTPVTGTANTGTNETLSMIAVDLNQDGKLDLLLTNANSYSSSGNVNTYNPDFVVLLGNGDGTFSPVIANTTLGNTAYAVAADFNGDGKPELAMEAGSDLVVLQATPTQTATATATGVSPAGPAPHLVDAGYPGDSNYSASTSNTTPLNVQVATPVLSVANGTYTSLSTIAIADATPGATIYYQGSGTLFTSGYVQYTGPIPVYGSGYASISVYATETGYQQSSTVTASYTFQFSQQAAAPTFSVPSGIYSGNQQIAISSGTPNAVIFYTTDGTVPTIRSTPYSGPLTISTPTLLNAMAVAPGDSVSATTSAQYLFSGAATSLVYTVAGNGMAGYTGDSGPATQAQIGISNGIAYDSAGNLYLSDIYNNVVRKIDANTGTISTIAGTGVNGFGGDGGPASQAQFNHPEGLAFDAAGNLYIADTNNSRIREIDARSGNITTVIGGATFTISGAGPTQLSAPRSVAVDSAGNLYIGSNYGLLQISAATKTNTWIANAPFVLGIAVDNAGDLFFLSGTYSVGYTIYPASIYEIPAGTTVGNYRPLSSYCIAACGVAPSSGAKSSVLNSPESIAVDSAGNLYVADTGFNVVQKITLSTNALSNVTAFAASQENGDGGLPAGAGVVKPLALAIDSSGNLAIADEMARIRKIIAYGALPTSTTATPAFSLAAGTYDNPQAVTVSDTTSGASIYYTLDGSSPAIAPGGYFGPIQIGGSANVQAIAVAPGYLPSNAASAAYTISSAPAATISTVAGNAAGKYSSCTSIVDGSAVSALQSGLGLPQNVAVDRSGNLYISDSYCNAVWRVAANTGTISLYAGNGAPNNPSSALGDGGPATSARLYGPRGIALDSEGNLYIADFGDSRVREVIASTGIITTVAGNGNTSYQTSSGNGDGGPATSATLAGPAAVAVDASGNLYASDSLYRVREVAASTGIISTVAGDGTSGYSGDGAVAVNAKVGLVNALSLDAAGNLYIADGAARIREVAAATGIITTVAGVGPLGYSGDGGPAVKAQIDVTGLAADPLGDLYLSNGNMVRVVSAANGTISTIAGSGLPGYWGDGGAATIAGMRSPSGLAFDSTGDLYLSDTGNVVVRQVTFTNNPAQPAPPAFTPPAGTYTGTQTVTITDSTAGSQIYYTTDGSTPTSGSTPYSGPISVSGNQTLKALAITSGRFKSLTATASYTILTPQTINFTAVSSPVTYGSAPITLAAVASSGLPITFSVVSGPGAISGDTLTITGAGTIEIAANQAGNSTYGPAQATQSLAVLPATPTIVWTPPAAILTGTTLSGTLTAAASFNSTAVAGNFAYTATPAGGNASPVTASTVLAAGSYTLSAAFTPADSGDYKSGTASATLAVNNPPPAIASLSPAFTQAGGVGFSLTVTGSGFVAGSTVYWGASALPTTLVSPTQLRATVASTSIASAGIAAVTVQTPAPGGGTSAPLQFEIDSTNSADSAPAFTTITATVTAGQSASYPVTLPSTASNVTVTCLNLPSGATCAYSAATSSVTIATTAATPAGTYQVTVVFSETITTISTGWVLLPFLLVPLLLLRKRLDAAGTWMIVVLAVVIAAGSAVAIGCGGGGGGGGSTTKMAQTQVSSSAAVNLKVN